MKPAAWFGLALVSLALVIAITACGGGGSSSVSASSPITVSVSASSNSVQAGGTDSFTATELNDASGKGVTWTVSCTASQCGTVSPTATASGVATTYTAPSVPPASDVTVTVKANRAGRPDPSHQRQCEQRSVRSRSEMVHFPNIRSRNPKQCEQQ